jgi:beta-galactosidase
MAVWYGGGKARAPMLEPDPRSKKEIWRRDLQAIRGLGFNAIRCWIDWASGEPAEKQYRFDTIDVLLELARDEGLKVIVQVYMDAAPDWVGRRYPDSLFVSSSGAVMKPESAPGYCVDHPGVARAVRDFYMALAAHVKPSPAFAGWDLWSEPHVINWATATYLNNAEFCFCPHTVARYRGWLRRKYGTLDALNLAWYRRFSSWDQVEPNRLSTILSYTDYIDWRNFIMAKLGEDLRTRFDAVKSVLPDRVATSHAAGPSMFSSPLTGDGTPDDWTMSRQADYWGTSLYPKHSGPSDYEPVTRAARLDFTRSASYSGQGRGFWIGELQGGFGTIALNVGLTVTPADLLTWTWTALSRGAKAINYYAWYPMNSGYESGGYGLIQLDGTITERSRAAGELARVVDRNAGLFLKAKPVEAQVAIIYNPLAYMVGGRQRAAAYGGVQGDVAGIERNSLVGVYRGLFPTNVPLDFVHIDSLEDIGRYKLVILPYPLMLPEKAARRLAQYVREGGALVGEARAGWNNERGYAAEAIPGMGLDAVFGCKETDVQSVAGGRTTLEWASGEIPGLAAGDRVAGRIYEETLEPRSGARVVARFASGAPAAVAADYGRGKALAIGSYIGAAYEVQRDPGAGRLFAGLLEWAGVRNPVAASGGVEVRLLRAGAETLAFVFNHARESVQPEIELRLAPAPVRGSDIVTGESVPLASSRSGVRFGRNLAAGRAWVVRLSP